MNPHPMSRDDRDVTTTIAIRSLTTSTIITEAARNFKLITQSTALDNLVFAGAPGGKELHPHRRPPRAYRH
jgi:hypothetical protein